jgi:hypothetical protein
MTQGIRNSNNFEIIVISKSEKFPNNPPLSKSKLLPNRSGPYFSFRKMWVGFTGEINLRNSHRNHHSSDFFYERFEPSRIQRGRTSSSESSSGSIHGFCSWCCDDTTLAAERFIQCEWVSCDALERSISACHVPPNCDALKLWVFWGLSWRLSAFIRRWFVQRKTELSRLTLMICDNAGSLAPGPVEYRVVWGWRLFQ